MSTSGLILRRRTPGAEKFCFAYSRFTLGWRKDGDDRSFIQRCQQRSLCDTSCRGRDSSQTRHRAKVHWSHAVHLSGITHVLARLVPTSKQNRLKLLKLRWRTRIRLLPLALQVFSSKAASHTGADSAVLQILTLE
ncbi:uncharacterized protein MYCFIDRAFT_212533 [Pseudocercospora fijiensis CIRAD86]|uniref:Uncharacterized protein n=1 Tax=Pseudocercospora fijiensis (strain CIRAD86) TaxID=383855 RepID=M2ZZU8_PSEFD|nr:uncharacterized protein MYCFIDRAFT_212533 [Pseudocercospora fijiensis CIRAD86]EME77681.1 hypothetical protein MYCFIDRAFT_212533 [Pseudocercospora fijiensis CIRAD86]